MKLSLYQFKGNYQGPFSRKSEQKLKETDFVKWHFRLLDFDQSLSGPTIQETLQKVMIKSMTMVIRCFPFLRVSTLSFVTKLVFFLEEAKFSTQPNYRFLSCTQMCVKFRVLIRISTQEVAC